MPTSERMHAGAVIKGWDAGVASMKKGEKAVLTCKPEYAYGAAGSPPKIPANATLDFEARPWRAELRLSMPAVTMLLVIDIMLPTEIGQAVSRLARLSPLGPVHADTGKRTEQGTPLCSAPALLHPCKRWSSSQAARHILA